jgi:hypothetical protein
MDDKNEAAERYARAMAEARVECLEREIARLQAEIEVWRGHLAEQCGHTLAARAMDKAIWVVLGEDGEYSDRDVFVSGVFAERGQAEAAMLERMAVKREHDNWDRRYHELRCAKRRALPPPARWAPLSEAEEAEVLSQLPAKPEYERAERCALYEVPVSQWITNDDALQRAEYDTGMQRSETV